MKVHILPEVYAEIMYYVHQSNVEISGLGRIQRASDGTLVVTKIYLLEQENGPASTDICPDAMSKLLYTSREDKGDLNFWWHSHVNMNTFWSGTDMKTIQDFGKKGYLLATVFNKKGEHRSAYYQGAGDFLPEVWVDNLPTHFNYLPTLAQTEAWKAEFEAKAKEVREIYTSRTYHKTSGSKLKDYGLSGWEEEDSSIPHAYKNPEYYKAKGIAAVDVVGANTGYTLDEIKARLRKLYYDKAFKLDDLDVMDTLMLYDVHEILYESDGTDDDIQELLEDVTFSEEGMNDVCLMLTEAVRDQIVFEKDKKGAVPVAQVVKLQHGNKSNEVKRIITPNASKPTTQGKKS